MVRIRRSHRRGPGSIPGQGMWIFWCVNILRSYQFHWNQYQVDFFFCVWIGNFTCQEDKKNNNKKRTRTNRWRYVWWCGVKSSCWWSRWFMAKLFFWRTSTYFPAGLVVWIRHSYHHGVDFSPNLVCCIQIPPAALVVPRLLAGRGITPLDDRLTKNNFYFTCTFIGERE